MNRIMSDGEPREVWRYFEEICAIPHGSGNTKQISDYLVSFAKEHELSFVQDEWNNVIISKDASVGMEEFDAIILQGHMDMVCEKTPGASIDMAKEGLSLYIEGDELRARDTTLGGDDGIAVAMGMALLADKTLRHPKLELVVTVDEETGMLGADAMDVSSLTGKTMINLDSEEEGIFLTGCAGGMTVSAQKTFSLVGRKGSLAKVTIDGLLGGHSGAEIEKHRTNATVLTGRLLFETAKKCSYSIVSLCGGEKDNVIPNFTEAALLFDKQEEQNAFAKELEEHALILQEELSASEPGLLIRMEELGEKEEEVLSKADQTTLLSMLINMPDGVQAMSADLEGLVETSLNLGSFHLENGTLQLSSLVRSSKDSAKNYLVDRLKNYLEVFGLEVKAEGDYPGWTYAPESRIRESFVKAYQEQYGSEPRITAIHAGLECGLFVNKIPGLDVVALGPDIRDIHTVNEALGISSTERTYKLVRTVLENWS